MILDNQTIGKVKGVTLIELGKGDVKVAAVRNFEDSYSGISFSDDFEKEIGTSDTPTGGTTDELNMKAILTFTKVESIDVVIKHLKTAKIWLNQINKTT